MLLHWFGCGGGALGGRAEGSGHDGGGGTSPRVILTHLLDVQLHVLLRAALDLHVRLEHDALHVDDGLFTHAEDTERSA